MRACVTTPVSGTITAATAEHANVRAALELLASSGSTTSAPLGTKGSVSRCQTIGRGWCIFAAVVHAAFKVAAPSPDCPSVATSKFVQALDACWAVSRTRMAL